MVLAAPGTSFTLDQGSNVDRYFAPEIQSPGAYGMEGFVTTKESDIYGMAMVIYEARSYRPVSPGRCKISR